MRYYAGKNADGFDFPLWEEFLNDPSGRPGWLGNLDWLDGRREGGGLVESPWDGFETDFGILFASFLNAPPRESSPRRPKTLLAGQHNLGWLDGGSGKQATGIAPAFRNPMVWGSQLQCLQVMNKCAMVSFFTFFFGKRAFFLPTPGDEPLAAKQDKGTKGQSRRKGFEETPRVGGSRLQCMHVSGSHVAPRPSCCRSFLMRSSSCISSSVSVAGLRSADFFTFLYFFAPLNFSHLSVEPLLLSANCDSFKFVKFEIFGRSEKPLIGCRLWNFFWTPVFKYFLSGWLHYTAHRYFCWCENLFNVK